jgi:hypothetical protein
MGIVLIFVQMYIFHQLPLNIWMLLTKISWITYSNMYKISKSSTHLLVLWYLVTLMRVLEIPRCCTCLTFLCTVQCFRIRIRWLMLEVKYWLPLYQITNINYIIGFLARIWLLFVLIVQVLSLTTCSHKVSSRTADYRYSTMPVHALSIHNFLTIFLLWQVGWIKE